MKSQVQKFVGYLLAGDQDSAWEIVLEEIQQGKNSLDIYENLITTAMRVTGDMWEENIISVADEHVATTTCDYVLTRYRFYKKFRDTLQTSLQRHCFYAWNKNSTLLV